MRASPAEDPDLESAEAAAYRNILRAGFEEIEVRPNLASPPRAS